MSTRTGQQIGNYQLTRFLGQGGFAEVYLAEHVHLGTQAAIKLLQMQVTDEVVQQFTHEARLIAALKSPHIVQVLDFGIERATPFLVMDYAPNGSLRQASPRGTRVSLATLVSYGKQIAGALQYAHDRKVIHRDVKPENMLVGVHGEILLSDFGIALISQSSRYQGKQEVGGTAAYMAPEQLMGRAVPASDQYALGIVVYEWLTGAVPFTGLFTEICSQHVLASPAPLRAQLPSLPSQVEAVVFQALAKEPGQRFRRIDEFAQALEQASQGIRFATPPAGDTSTFVNQDITSTYINIDSPGAQFPHSGQMPGAQSQPLQSTPTFQMGPQVASSQVGQSTWFAPLPEMSRTNPQTGLPAPRRPGPPTAPASGMPGMELQYDDQDRDPGRQEHQSL